MDLNCHNVPITITEGTIADMLGAIRSGPASRPVVAKRDSCAPSPPALGSLYFGSFDRFAGRKPHYGMARGGFVRQDAQGKHVQGEGPIVPLSPITSVKQNGPMVLQLPHGSLPCKRGKQGAYLQVVSYLLLGLRLLVGRKALFRDFDPVGRLPNELLTRAAAMLHSEIPS